MVRVTILSIFIVSLFAFSSIQCEDEQLSVKMETIDNLTNFLQANPKVRLQPLYRNQLSRGQIRYTLGNRLTGKLNQFLFVHISFVNSSFFLTFLT